MTMPRIALLCLILFLLSAAVAKASSDPEQPLIVRYPQQSQERDPNGQYLLALLQEALSLSHRKFQLIASPDPMQQARAIYEMRANQGSIDLLWTTTTDQRERELIPVRIPLDKGLFGWRICLLARPGLLNGVKTLVGLRQFNAGQGYDWPDVDVLRANQLPVITATGYAPLFGMLKGGRFDYFPRSVLEIQHELEQHPQLNLTIDPSLALHYPTALYFFVTPRNPALAHALQQGLEKMLRNGRFEQLFQHYLGPLALKAQLHKRNIIELRNPLLQTGSLPLRRSELWFRP